MRAYGILAQITDRQAWWRGRSVDWGRTWSVDPLGAWLTASEGEASAANERFGLEGVVTPVDVEEIPVFDTPIPDGPIEPTFDELVAAALKESGRNTVLLQLLADKLANEGSLRVRAPRDPKACTSLRERIYSAAKRANCRVSVKLQGGYLIAQVAQCHETLDN